MPKRNPHRSLTAAQALAGQHVLQADISRSIGQSEKYVSQQLRYERTLTAPVAEYLAFVAGFEVAGEVARLCREAMAAEVQA